ncbi:MULTISPECIES: 5,6-dimethylbenzimidazole synthase [Acidianus]|uniref:Cob(II)yrinic acid a,c-diamide reductase n=1 Tax=Candidatus Acidianus copahuensis TaxID=1160895 RepID=A0A031LV41_9CREN|nr:MULTISPECIES: 5,6-dimethylbenzimidazole synthase [Acidianus]EZQ11369.1 cob(II)yrinic acid a,c-diamide reductase [Candidatus Acidianus copahuensis]NON61750.1 5,6-dimethylbenzimidazole synthase [Acidianus sp. RZ1]
MDVYEAIKKRRDIRSSFKKEPIPDEVLSKILLAAHLAPSVGYSQPWNFILIYSEDTRRRILEEVMRQREVFKNKLEGERKELFSNIKIEGILDTPLNIAITCDPSRFGPNVLGRHTMPETCEFSTVLGIENMWLAARSEGIGIGWVSFMDKETIKRILGIPENVKLIAYLCIGYVTSFPEKPELEEKGWGNRLRLSDLVYVDKWGEGVKEDLRKSLDNVKI